MSTTIKERRDAYIAATNRVDDAVAAYDAADATAASAAKTELDAALAAADVARGRLANTGLRLEVNEPDMYTRESNDFLRDLYFSQVKSDPVATERIARHQSYEVEKYAVSTGTLGGAIPPQYLVTLYGKAQRFGRVLADQCNIQPIPEVGMSFVVPRLTGGTSAAAQTSESSTVSTTDPTETDLTVNVRTIAGYSPVSRQTLERAAYSEQILFEDLIARYYAALDTQLISGSGSSGQHLGILNVSGTSTATLTSWSIQNFVNAVWGENGVITAINSWAATIGTPADKIFMHPRRWGAVASLLDSSNRPLFQIDALPNYGPVGEGQVAGYGMVGHIAGLPVYTDANIPTNQGASTNQDVIIVMASPAVLLWESEGGQPMTLAFEQQAGTSLQVQLVATGYSAFTAGRYPAATGVVSGAGLT